ncbi:MAG TPA: NAD(P)-dependent oxidoreductase [Planctomycetota bacterium]|nr:NAD(P)-dependent oxidoreductase [Planctomycetota bacterium]
MRVLVNLPAGFATCPGLAPIWSRLRAAHDVAVRSSDDLAGIRDELALASAALMWSWPELDAAALDGAPSLRFLGHIDVRRRAAELALARGLTVSTSRRCWAPAVAEMALTLILSSLRRTVDHHVAMRAGNERWVRRFPDDIDARERELTGRAVGIVGFGAVGQRLAALLAPFSCALSVHDPHLPPAIAAARGARLVGLDQLIADCDVIVLCAASNAGSRHLIGARELAALRRDAVLVNVARAALVDTDALIARLGHGDLQAAVDVFDTEPLPADHPLRRAPNLLMTPHRAGGALSSVARAFGWLVDDLEAFAAGRPLTNPLTPAAFPGLDD